MLWWHWFLIGAGTIMLLEAILIGAVLVIGKRLNAWNRFIY